MRAVYSYYVLTFYVLSGIIVRYTYDKRNALFLRKRAMTNKERWLSAAALLISILPFILVAGSIQLLPNSIILPNIVLTEEAIKLPKYQYLTLGFFGFVPVALVAVARFLRQRKLVERNFMWMIIASFVLGFVFLSVTVYGMIDNIIKNDIDLLKKFDFFGASAVVASLAGGMLANFFPQLRRNDVLGLKNKYTMNDNRVWVKVHYAAADVYMSVLYAFAVFTSALSIWLDFRLGWLHLVLWVAVISGLIVWGRLYSRRQWRKLNRNAEKQVL